MKSSPQKLRLRSSALIILLKEPTSEERDILLLGSLVTLSVAFPKLIGKYGDNPVNANLFIFVSAKASAGKGILIHCRKLVEPRHLNLREQAKLLKRQYEIEMQDYNANKAKDSTIEKPQKPPQRMYSYLRTISLLASWKFSATATEGQ